MKIRKMQEGGYPVNVRELLSGLESDLRGGTITPPARDPDIETNRRRRTQGPLGPELPEGFSPPSFRPIRSDSQFYTPEEQRQREFMRPGGTSDQYKQAMGEAAAGFVPGLGDAIEAGYIGRDAAAGDYDAAGLGALLMLLPGALGRYGSKAYSKIRSMLPDKGRTEAIEEVTKNLDTRLTPYQRGLRDAEMQQGRQTVQGLIDETADSQVRLNRARLAKPLQTNVETRAGMVASSRILDESIPLAERKKMVLEQASKQPDSEFLKKQIESMSDDDFRDMLQNTREGEEQLEMLLGNFAGMAGAPEDILASAASRRGGMPYEEFLRRLSGNPDPSVPLGPEAQRVALRLMQANADDRLATELLETIAKIQERTGKFPSDETIDNVENILRRERFGVAPHQLELRGRNAPRLNKNGGKILKYRKG